jgi:hypothetical protein
MKKSIPPPHIIDAIKNNKFIDPKDPWIRKFMIAERKKERNGLTIKEFDEEKKKEDEEKRKDDQIKHWEQFQINVLVRECQQFLQLEEDIKNTINWNYLRSCKYCESKSMRIILKPNLIHYAEYRCNLCDKHNDWIPYSGGFFFE